MSAVMATAVGVAVYIGQSDKGHSSAAPFTHAFETPHLWVGTADDGVAMVELTRTGSSLSGSFDVTAIPSSDRTTTKAEHAAFTGTVDGSAVTIRIDGALGSVGSLSGTLTNTEMILHVPHDTGTMYTLTLRPGSVDDYNSKVGDLQSRARHALTDLQDAQAKEAQAAADAETRGKIDAAATKVNSAYTALKQTLGVSVDYSSFETDLATVRSDLKTVKDNAANLSGEDACIDAGSVEMDAGTVEMDAGTLESDRGTLDYTISDIESQSTALKDAWDAYETAQGLMPEYTPVLSTGVGGVSKLRTNAKDTVSAIKSKGDGYVKTGKDLAAEARRVSDAAVGSAC
ncbi:hypothetical protein [Streptomyces glomeratus]|uniref:hypothetical protein n=1 Tax=Streptomyces glomeratus TaxID=284452 RepID=UPI0031D42F3D